MVEKNLILYDFLTKNLKIYNTADFPWNGSNMKPKNWGIVQYRRFSKICGIVQYRRFLKCVRKIQMGLKQMFYSDSFNFYDSCVFQQLQECLYPGQRGEVLEFPCRSPRTRRISKSSAKASDLEILLVLGLWQGNSNTSPLWSG